MAKDPAFLFYPGDWLGGTIGMSFEVQGAYLNLLILQFNKGNFTEKQATNLVGSDNWNELKENFSLENGLFFNKRLKVEKERRSAFTESRRQSRLKSKDDNVRIYIVRDNVRNTYKIGSSVNPLRRYNELSNQQNPAIMQSEYGARDITLIWYSPIIVERSEENKLHEKYSNKRIVGEWFNLTDDDINDIKLTYVERTEIENVNEDVIEERKIKFVNKVAGYENEFGRQMLLKFCDYWTEHNENGKKMRFEMERVFDIKRRLNTWNNNDKKFSNVNRTNTSQKERHFNLFKDAVNADNNRQGSFGG